MAAAKCEDGELRFFLAWTGHLHAILDCSLAAFILVSFEVGLTHFILLPLVGSLFVLESWHTNSLGPDLDEESWHTNFLGFSFAEASTSASTFFSCFGLWTLVPWATNPHACKTPLWSAPKNGETM